MSRIEQVKKSSASRELDAYVRRSGDHQYRKKSPHVAVDEIETGKGKCAEHQEQRFFSPEIQVAEHDEENGRPPELYYAACGKEKQCTNDLVRHLGAIKAVDAGSCDQERKKDVQRPPAINYTTEQDVGGCGDQSKEKQALSNSL